jgi:hypothetical protein
MELSAEKPNVRAQNVSLAHPVCSFNIGSGNLLDARIPRVEFSLYSLRWKIPS